MATDLTPWLTIARGEIGVHETTGPKHTPRILEYHQATRLKATADEIPWCSAFVTWCLAQAGVASTRSAMARSYLDWGVHLAYPVVGCVVVYPRGDNAAQGHVGFVESVNGKKIGVLSGNSQNSVNVKQRFYAGALGFRWPADVALPQEARGV
jgi:uncharacterized protein (TIGR02594 family)